MNIQYEGKMTDKYPAWAWTTLSSYVLNPFNSVKILDYLRERYGNKKPKIFYAGVNMISDSEVFIRNKLKEWKLERHFGVLYGYYYYDVETDFIINEYQYSIKQEGLMFISEGASSVVVKKVKMLKAQELIMEL